MIYSFKAGLSFYGRAIAVTGHKNPQYMEKNGTTEKITK
jgi:hypothetical protein